MDFPMAGRVDPIENRVVRVDDAFALWRPKPRDASMLKGRLPSLLVGPVFDETATSIILMHLAAEHPIDNRGVDRDHWQHKHPSAPEQKR